MEKRLLMEENLKLSSVIANRDLNVFEDSVEYIHTICIIP